ncbi:unnamed protein product [Urochloa humidicola]
MALTGGSLSHTSSRKMLDYLLLLVQPPHDDGHHAQLKVLGCIMSGVSVSGAALAGSSPSNENLTVSRPLLGGDA